MVQFSRLRLSGFKSFVDPTDVVIAPGMTGVVGPNGCGKSNLVEALRWVMGENSPKRMRGGEMDDVIFAGSATRPARNVAEVQVSLDNSDRRAPAQFNDSDELQVVRRIERGSGSAYKINGKDVRARDVQLLFADAATGAHSTALVSQGRVGALINAKPAERRALLEEAAGITGLHSRRHEAELRLKAAETNLERLDDVISTLESQLSALKRQARQASRYRNIAEQIRRTEAILLMLEGEEARVAASAAAERLAAAEAKVAELTEQVAACTTAQAGASEALPELRQAEAAAAAELQRLTIARESLAQEEARITAAREQAEQRLSQIETDERHAGGLAEDATTAIGRLETEKSELSDSAEGEEERHREAIAAQRTAQEAAAASEQALTDLSQQLAADETRAGGLARRIEELERRLSRIRDEAAEVGKARDDLAGSEGDDAALREVERQLGEAESALEAARATAEATEAELAHRREAESQARETLQAAEAEKGRLTAEIDALSRLLESNQADAWPPVIDQVRAEPGYEAALAAALGEDLEAPADEAAPIHWQKLPAYSDTPDLPAGARPLADFVKAPDALARALGQVGVVADSGEARRLQPGLRPGQRLVSPDGALARWDGFTAAAGAPNGAQHRLEQRNRLSDLRKELTAVEAKVEKARQDFGAARDQASKAADAERGAREALSAAYNRVNEARAAQTRETQRVAQQQSRLSTLVERSERLAGDIAEAEQALAEARKEHEELPDLAAARARITELRADVAEKRTILSQRQSAVERIEREAEQRQRRLAAIEQEQASWAERKASAERHLASLAERREAAATEIEELKEKPAALVRQREELAETIEAAEAKRQAAADALTVGEGRLRDADRSLKTAEAELGTAREEKVRAEGGREAAEQAGRQVTARVRERLECEPADLPELAGLDPGASLPDKTEIETKLQRLTRERDNMGPVNLRAEQEARELEEQIAGMQNEREDLTAAISRLRQGIASLNREGRERLLNAFEVVDQHFSELFVRLFGGGKAHLKMTEADDPLEAGLEIMASPPGKRLQVMSLLSGGEQALTALALLFAVFLTNPAPICVLDEVDAPLDDANVDRFCTLVDELARTTSTRFLVITHHRMTMARMDRLFGVTMGERGVSQLVSVDLHTAEGLRESA